jgi:hypothetical protein
MNAVKKCRDKWNYYIDITCKIRAEKRINWNNFSYMVSTLLKKILRIFVMDDFNKFFWRIVNLNECISDDPKYKKKPLVIKNYVECMKINMEEASKAIHS